MNRTYLFYDLETSGLNKAFDQVMQFAAIRTDSSFNELERYNILIKLNPDVIPAPQAMITHMISLEESMSGECEYEAICKIHALFNVPGTISLGYNTLGFDDEFMRFSFYRNLLTPYTHQYANHCSRMDLYPMAVMYFLYKPEVIQWPELNGKPTLKLEYLSEANHLAEGAAHNAMVDVEATVALAKRFKQESAMWDYLCGYFDKETDLNRMMNLTPVFEHRGVPYRQALMVEGSYGADSFYQMPVLSLGTHHHYKNQTLWLRLNATDLMQTSVDSISKTTWAERKKVGEPGLLLPTHERFMHHLSDKRVALIKENEAWLQAHPKIFEAIANYYCEYIYPEIPNCDVDAALYQNGFLSNFDRSQCERFHMSALIDKVEMLDSISNPNLKNQAIRILGRNYPDALPDNYLNCFEEYLFLAHIRADEGQLIDYRGQKRLTLHEALADIVELRKESLSEKQVQRLDELEQHFKKI